ncbi:hypothetical protein [Actinomadura luteofluorescens]|uniref:hypothetical protein n=1 Tax=Actinomadura luteofluorescens TaxID=46163 RepID=UPI003D927F84
MSSISCTIFNSTPAAGASVAASCRRSCNRTGGASCSAISFWNAEHRRPARLRLL